MTLSLQYDEINKFIKKRTGKEIEIEYVDKDTIHVSHQIQLPFFGKQAIGIDLKILGFNDTTLQVKAASDVISKLLSLIPSLDISKYAVVEKDVIHILLGNIEELRKPLMNMRPTGVRLDKGYLHLDMKIL